MSARFPTPLCRKFNLEDFILIREDQCLFIGNQYNDVGDNFMSRVAEVNGSTLDRALILFQRRNDSYAVVLVYAKWCPFSKTLRATFDTVSSQFPGIYHFAVEDSVLRPSSLSQFGLHSFPALFIHNKTHRVRYYGARTVESITQFYRNITGLEPVDASHIHTDKVALIEQLSTVRVPNRKESCPYPWAKSPDMWLRDDIYLALAVAFLSLRLVFYLLPKLLIGIKSIWIKIGISGQVHRGLHRKMGDLKEEPRINPLARSMSVSSRKKEIVLENKENGKGVLVVPGWSSSSLATVTLAEGSSSRPGTADDSRENVPMYRSHLWG